MTEALDSQVLNSRQRWVSRVQMACDGVTAPGMSSVSSNYARLRQLHYVASQLQKPNCDCRAALMDLVAEAFQNPIDSSPTGPLLFSEADCVNIKDRRNESPALIPSRISAGVSIASPRSPMPSAYAMLNTWSTWMSLYPYLDQVVTLSKRGLWDTVSSYTLTICPGVVYADCVDDAARMAEILVHETAHNRLNAYLALFEPLSSSPTWWSPWRKMQRPAFGILHAMYAFSHVVAYFNWLLEGENSALFNRQYILLRLKDEACALLQTYQSATEALALVTDEALNLHLNVTFSEAKVLSLQRA